jgi:hypothetical protein
MMPTTDSVWNLTGTHAQLESPRLVVAFDLSHPEEGIGGVEVATHPHTTRIPLDARLLRVVSERANWRWEGVTEGYVRGADLIANYGPASAPALLPQIYWRWISPTGHSVGGIEAVISMQTLLLEDTPTLVSSMQMAMTELLQGSSGSHPAFTPVSVSGHATLGLTREHGAGLFLCRSADADLSYLIMVHPTDYESVEITRLGGDRFDLRFQLFPERLEKGVIRRGRLRGVFLPRTGDEASAAAAYADFLQSPPPLTT